MIEPQLQLRSRPRHHAQRIMRRIMPADPRQPQPIPILRVAADDLKRVVLEHHQRVEQLTHPKQALDLGKAEILISDQFRLTVLYLLEQITQRF